MFHELDRGGKCKSHHQLVVNSNQRSWQRHDKPGAW